MGTTPGGGRGWVGGSKAAGEWGRAAASAQLGVRGNCRPVLSSGFGATAGQCSARGSGQLPASAQLGVRGNRRPAGVPVPDRRPLGAWPTPGRREPGRLPAAGASRFPPPASGASRFPTAGEARNPSAPDAVSRGPPGIFEELFGRNGLESNSERINVSFPRNRRWNSGGWHRPGEAEFGGS